MKSYKLKNNLNNKHQVTGALTKDKHIFVFCFIYIKNN